MRELRLPVILSLALVLSCAACRAKTERAPEPEPQTQPVVAPDGSIHLKPEQVQANGVQTVAVFEQEVATTLTAVGRVKARAGGEAQVFSPFAGRLLADPAQLPRVGSVLKRGTVIAEVEQLLTTTEQAQIREAAAQFAATAVQQQAAINQAQQAVTFRQTELERGRQLYEGGAIPLKQLQTAEFELKQAQAQLEGAKRSKAQAEAAQAQQRNVPRRAPIVAPISGTVVAAELTAGQQTNTAIGDDRRSAHPDATARASLAHSGFGGALRRRPAICVRRTRAGRLRASRGHAQWPTG